MIWFLIGLFVLTFLINRLSLDYGFDKLDYKMEIEKKNCEIGEEIQINSTLENNKFLTISYLKVEEFFKKGFNIESNTYSLFIMPFQRVKRSYNIEGRKRGKYKIRNVTLELGDFLGFNSKYKEIEIEDNEVIIFPKKEKLKNIIKPYGSLYGEISVKRWIVDDPLMNVGIREYTGNEPERFIHWPSSIKYNNLMVKQFDFTTDNSAIVLLNLETSKPYWKSIDGEGIEKAIIATRAVMEEFEENKIPYGFASNAYNHGGKYSKGYFFHPGLGHNQLNKFLEILGASSFLVSASFEETLSNMARVQGNYTTVVIVTPKILQSYIKPINLLSSRVTNTVIISMDNKDLDKLSDKIIKYKS